MSNLSELIKEYRFLSHKRQNEPGLLLASDLQRIDELKSTIDQRMTQGRLQDSGSWNTQEPRAAQSSGGWRTAGLFSPPHTPLPASASPSVQSPLLFEEKENPPLSESPKFPAEELPVFQPRSFEALPRLEPALLECLSQLRELEVKRRISALSETEELFFRSVMDQVFSWLPAK